MEVIKQQVERGSTSPHPIGRRQASNKERENNQQHHHQQQHVNMGLSTPPSSLSSSGSSGASRSRHRAATASGESAAKAPLDPAAQQLIAQLEQLTLELSVAVRHEGDVRYVLTVHHARARALWKHPRSFDQYHAFQERMLAALHQGHFCSAGCPWLANFLISYFPNKKRFLLGTTSKIVVERRRDALAHVLQTIRTFLLNRENLSCSVVKTHVAHEFLRFVYGELVDEHNVLGDMPAVMQLPAAAVLDTKMVAKEALAEASSLSNNSEDAAAVPSMMTDRGSFIGPASGNIVLDTCALCQLPMPVKNIYVMKLCCGHRFHDECILPKLNEDLRCPTCGKLDAVY